MATLKLKALWNLMKGSRALYIGAIICVALTVLMSLLPPLVISFTIDSVIGDTPMSAPQFLSDAIEKLGGLSVLARNIWICGIAIVSISLVQGVFAFLRGRWSAIASEKVALNLRDNLYDHLQHLPYEYHVKAQTGDLIQRCTSDVETIRRFLSSQMVEMGRAIFIVIFSVTFMLQINLRMTLVSMAIIPFILAFSFFFFRQVQKLFKTCDEQEGKLSAVLQENLSGVRVVRAFARSTYEVDKFEKENSTYRDMVTKLIRLLAVYWSTSDLLCFFQIAAVLSLGIYTTVQGDITVGNLVMFLSYESMLLWPVRQLGRILTDLGKTFVALDRTHEILHTPEEDLCEDGKTPSLQGDIEFSNVCFAYDENRPIFNNLSFTIKKGETIAILGHTGSGKSSLVHLLLRLYDYNSGSIKIGGVELKDINKKWLRQKIGIVLQEPFLYSKTIIDNIKMARENVTNDEIHKAATSAAVHDVILGFEKGYETAVGEKGVTLSGGQKQRVAIARTLIKNSDILVFDDSLSAVDTHTDAAIREALKEESQNITTFIVSHRLTTLSSADRIFVIEDGKLAMTGTHEELIQQDCLYKRIWEIQNMRIDDLADDEAEQRAGE